MSQVSGQAYWVFGVFRNDFLTLANIASKKSLGPAGYRLSPKLTRRRVKVKIGMNLHLEAVWSFIFKELSAGTVDAG